MQVTLGATLERGGDNARCYFATAPSTAARLLERGKLRRANAARPLTAAVCKPPGACALWAVVSTSSKTTMDPREAVTNNDDLWAAVLRQLCARQLCSAARLCHAHRSLVARLLSERDFLQVTFGPRLKGAPSGNRPERRHLALTERLRPTTGAPLGLPQRCPRWRSGGGDATAWDPPAMPGVHEDAPGIFLSSTKLVMPSAAQHDCASFITALLARFPGLSSLSRPRPAAQER